MERISAALLAVSPHVVIGARGVIWADARGLPAREVADAVLAIAKEQGIEDARVGIARIAIAAEMAATVGRTPVMLVTPGDERAFLAPYPLRMLAEAAPTPPLPKLSAALADVGIEHCGELAALTLEEVEVRFGADGVALWRLARADDQRRVFEPRTRALASASLAWEEYALRDTERLAFVINRLAGTVCTELGTWGEAARAMTLTLALTSRTSMERQVRSSRPTSNRVTWVRLLRAELERIKLRDAVVGLSLRVDAAGEMESPQGDIFDRGLHSSRAVEEALTRLLDDQQATIVGLTRTEHPRLEDRAQWHSRELGEVLRGLGSSGKGSRAPSLSLQLLPRARPIAVQTAERRDHCVPVSYRERAQAQRRGAPGASRVSEVAVLTTVGPDRISGGAEVGELYARDYYQCVTADGLLVLLYRDALAGQWYLHGWWD
jgi:protein ImuB